MKTRDQQPKPVFGEILNVLYVLRC
jgi:hypothetical protein